MDEFVTVCKRADIPKQGGRTVSVNGKLVAVFDDRGTLCAIDDLCPHMGASLAGGELEDGIVTCAWHHWRFRVCDGTWADNPRIKIPCFEVRIVGEDVQVCSTKRESGVGNRESGVSGQWMDGGDQGSGESGQPSDAAKAGTVE